MLDFITRDFRLDDRDRIGAIDGGPRGSRPTTPVKGNRCAGPSAFRT